MSAATQDLILGEKMRAGLTISLMSQPPQRIILDEPTSHLNLDATLAAENAIKPYQDAILAVSHEKNVFK